MWILFAFVFYAVWRKKYIPSSLFTWVSLAGTQPARTPVSPVLLQKIKLKKSQEKKTKSNMILTSPHVLAVVMQSNSVVYKIYIMHLFKKMVHK